MCHLSVLSAQGGGDLCGCTAVIGLSTWILLLWTKCSYSPFYFIYFTACHFSALFSMQSWVIFPLNGDTSLENFSHRENNIAAVFRR